MDPDKVQAVRDWPTPKTRKQLQHFLSFVNFYRWLIKNFSSITAPLHTLTSSESHYLWNNSAETAFCTLTDKFASAPLLTIPDPKLQFIVGVVSLEVGFGAVSQRSPMDNCLHPCAFLSKKLSPAKLRCWQLGAISSQCHAGGMAPLAGGREAAIFGLDGPLCTQISAVCQAPQCSPCQVGAFSE